MIDRKKEADRISGLLKIGSEIVSNVKKYKVIKIDVEWVICTDSNNKTINLPGYKILRGVDNGSITINN